MNGARLITATEQHNTLTSHCTISEAAKKLGVSETAIRKTARRLGVKKIAGRTVAGFILFESHPVPVSVAYSA